MVNNKYFRTAFELLKLHEENLTPDNKSSTARLSVSIRCQNIDKSGKRDDGNENN